MLTRTLQLAFVTEDGSNATMSIKEPKSTLSEAEVKQAIDTIIHQNVFAIKGVNFAAAKSAKLVERYVTTYEI